MKSTLLSFFLASAALVAAADPPSLAGKWQVHSNIMGYENDLTCTFSQKENELAGSCGGDQGAVNISGKVDGQNVIWVYKSEYNGGPITLTYKGSLQSPEKIAGSVSVEEYNVDGEFTATLSK